MDLGNKTGDFTNKQLKAPVVEGENCCKQCNKLFSEIERPAWEWHGDNVAYDTSSRTAQHHDNIEEVWHAARSKCQLCRVILSEITQTTGSPSQTCDVSINYSHKREDMDVDAVEVVFMIEVTNDQTDGNDQDGGASTERIELPFRIEYDNATKQQYVYREKTFDLVSPQPICHYTGSPASLDLVCEWLHDCTTSHTACMERPAPTFFPTRVLDLGVGNTCNIRLLLSKERFESMSYPPYMTLSHQWSASAEGSPKLTQESMAKLCESIALPMLPKVFQEAVILTRRLGIRYLWIDRLCIIQDSATDWQAEAALMGSVYAFSFCSIAASDANSPGAGCFMGRDHQTIVPWHQKVVASNLFLPTTYLIIPGVGVSGEIGSKDDRNSWRTILDKSSLYSRGWVLQESILAPRIIHCSRKQLYWECPSAINSEVFPKGLPKPLRISDSMFNLRRKLAAPNAPMATLIKSDDSELQKDIETRIPELSHSNWTEIVEMYTDCRLSYSKDKLIAISGVAESMMPRFGTYAAGLWKEKMHFGLLWYTRAQHTFSKLKMNKDPNRPAFPYRAPSWSWASVDSPVVFDSTIADDMNFTLQRLITVVDVQTTATQLNGLGEVSAGSLRLTGEVGSIVCQLAEITKANGVHRSQVVITSIEGHEFANFESVARKEDSMVGLLRLTEARRFQRQTSIVQFDDPVTGVKAAAADELLCLPVVKQRFAQKWSVRGLVLVRNGSLGIYRRVGYFSAEGFDTPMPKFFAELKPSVFTIV